MAKAKVPSPALWSTFAQQLLTEHPKEAARAFTPIVSLFREVLDAGYRTADLHRGQTKHLATTTEMARQVETAVADVMERRRAYHAV